MEALIRELGELTVPDLPEYEPDEVAFGDDRNTAFYEVLDAYPRALRLGDLMWQHHFEFLLLGYGAYATFVEFCKGNLPDIPDQHIAQMVAGIDVLLFRPDAELRRLARLAIETGVDARVRPGPLAAARSTPSWRERGGPSWLDELEKVKDPWFNMATGDGLYHYYRSWLDDPSIPYAALIGHISALRAGEQIDRPTEEIQRERDRLATEYGALLDEDARAAFNDLLNLSRTVFPYVEEHKFFCDYWFLTRWWNKIREFGALLARNGFLEDGEDVFQLSRYEVASALDELVLTWATGGAPLGPKHWPPIVARRKEMLERLGDWTPPPALGVTPEAVTDPMTIMLWGVTTERVQEWARQADGGTVLNGAAASPGVVEGLARVVRSVDQIGDVRDGEILVCGITSPAWAPIFSKIRATVTDVGGVMSHAAIVAASTGCRRSSAPGARLADPHRADDPRRRHQGTVTMLVSRCTTRPLAATLAAATSRASAARARTSVSCSRRGSRCRRGSRSRPRRSRRSYDEAGRCRSTIASASPASGDAMRAAPIPDDVRAEVSEQYARLGDDVPGRGPLERGRRGQRGGDVRRPAGDLPVGARRRQRVRRGARLLGEPLQPAGDQLPGAARPGRRAAGDGRDRAADGRRRGLGGDVHLQPGQRRPEHGRDQRQLGARAGGRRRRGHPRRLPRQQGHRRGGARARARQGRSSTCRTRAARRGPRRGPGGAPRARVPRRSSARAAGRARQRVERHFGSHQDVEWAIARDGDGDCSSSSRDR